MGEVRLVKPAAERRQAYLAFYQEWKDSGEPMVPWVISKDPADFDAMLKFLFDSEKPDHLPGGWVPGSTYWLVNDREDIVGAVNIRHWLNENLLNTGGHIGYGIRPSERRKGYATKILALALEKARELGITDALVCCDKENIGSERTILKNGGVFESEFVEEDGNVVKRFWITL